METSCQCHFLAVDPDPWTSKQLIYQKLSTSPGISQQNLSNTDATHGVTPMLLGVGQKPPVAAPDGCFSSALDFSLVVCLENFSHQKSGGAIALTRFKKQRTELDLECFGICLMDFPGLIFDDVMYFVSVEVCKYFPGGFLGFLAINCENPIS